MIYYEDLLDFGLGDVMHTRVLRSGRKPSITTPEVTARRENIEPKIVPLLRQPRETERNQMKVLALAIAILADSGAVVKFLQFCVYRCW